MQRAGAGALAAAWDEANPGRGTAWSYEQSWGWGKPLLTCPLLTRGGGALQRGGVGARTRKGEGGACGGPSGFPWGARLGNSSRGGPTRAGSAG